MGRDPEREEEREQESAGEPGAYLEWALEDAEPQDAVAPEYAPVSAGYAADSVWAPLPETLEPPPDLFTLVSFFGKAIAYTAAAAWPFVWAWLEYVSLNDSPIRSNVCSYSGCVGRGSVFAGAILGWLPVMSGGSVFAVWAAIRLRRRLRARPRREGPVNRLVLAGLFVGVCALAFLVGVLRGVVIAHTGH